MADTARNGSCDFCEIAANKARSDSDELVAFADIAPIATHHYLVIPKKHIKNVEHLTRDDIPMLNAMKKVGMNLLKRKDVNIDEGIDEARFGFHWPRYTTVDHLHMHCVAPVSSMHHVHRDRIFKPGTECFATVEEITKWLEKR